MDVASRYPLLTYRDISRILESLSSAPRQDAFGSLVNHYQQFLQRENRILELIDLRYEMQEVDDNRELRELTCDETVHKDNDRGLSKLYYLAKFRDYLLTTSCWTGSDWELNKNQIGGVWLAGCPNPGCYIFLEEFRELSTRISSDFCFHIGLKDGIFAKSPEHKAGTIQLRCGAKSKSKEETSRLREEFGKIYRLRESERRVQAKQGKTVGLVETAFSEQEMLFEKLLGRLTSFANQFGIFQE